MDMLLKKQKLLMVYDAVMKDNKGGEGNRND